VALCLRSLNEPSGYVVSANGVARIVPLSNFCIRFSGLRKLSSVSDNTQVIGRNGDRIIVTRVSVSDDSEVGLTLFWR